MNFIEENLKKIIKEAIVHAFDYKIEDELLMIEIPKDKINGDYATNIAMRLTKLLQKNPKEIATTIANLVKEDKSIEKVEVAGPGFINFWVAQDVLTTIINEVIEKQSTYGHSQYGANCRILVEYVSANPTGNLHVGHARCAAWGDACTRLLKSQGYDCLREYYINDAGNQMANLGRSIYERYRELFGETCNLPEDGYHGQDIIDIAEIIKKEHGDQWLHMEQGRLDFFTEEGKKQELIKIENDLAYYRCNFDSWFSEKSLYDSHKVEAAVELLKEKGLTYELDGALWFKTMELGDDKDRVLIKNDGSYTYLTPDIANHLYKMQRGYTKLVNLLGADHHGYIARMKAAMVALGYQKDDLEIDIIQMVRIVDDGVEVKMSKRTGNAITLRELCDDIGVDAARYFVLQRAVDTHFDFDLALARKKSNENPVYYVQYAHARICSILSQTAAFESVDSYDLLIDEKELALMKYINEFKDVTLQAAISRMPNKICNYAQKLASLFHSFYATNKVNDSTQPALTNQRIGLLHATKITLANALDLLGVEACEKM